MRKGLEHMDNRELLIELVRTQRRDTFLEHVTAIINLVFLAVMILVLVILVPKAVTTLREVDRTVKEVNTLALEAQESLDGIDVMVGRIGPSASVFASPPPSPAIRRRGLMTNLCRPPPTRRAASSSSVSPPSAPPASPAPYTALRQTPSP